MMKGVMQRQPRFPLFSVLFLLILLPALTMVLVALLGGCSTSLEPEENRTFLFTVTIAGPAETSYSTTFNTGTNQAYTDPEGLPWDPAAGTGTRSAGADPLSFSYRGVVDRANPWSVSVNLEYTLTESASTISLSASYQEEVPDGWSQAIVLESPDDERNRAAWSSTGSVEQSGTISITCLIPPP